jgi:hypothetical protein
MNANTVTRVHTDVDPYANVKMPTPPFALICTIGLSIVALSIGAVLLVGPLTTGRIAVAVAALVIAVALMAWALTTDHQIRHSGLSDNAHRIQPSLLALRAVLAEHGVEFTDEHLAGTANYMAAALLANQPPLRLVSGGKAVVMFNEDGGGKNLVVIEISDAV